MKLTGLFATLLTLQPIWLAAAAPAEVPQYSDHPAARSFTGRAATVRLVTAQDRKYRTRLLAAAGTSPNFAGNYILALWGCGTACTEGAVIDPKTGTISWLPYFVVGCSFGLTCGDQVEPPQIEFRADSRLLILNGQRGIVQGRSSAPSRENISAAGRFYYLFEHGQFRLLRADRHPQTQP